MNFVVVTNGNLVDHIAMFVYNPQYPE